MRILLFGIALFVGVSCLGEGISISKSDLPKGWTISRVRFDAFPQNAKEIGKAGTFLGLKGSKTNPGGKGEDSGKVNQAVWLWVMPPDYEYDRKNSGDRQSSPSFYTRFLGSNDEVAVYFKTIWTSRSWSEYQSDLLSIFDLEPSQRLKDRERHRHQK